MSRIRLPGVSRYSALIGLLAYLLFAAGCATVPAGVNNSDPLETVNRKVYAFNDSLDRHVMTPVANAYMKITPQPVQTSISKFYNNLTYPNVVINEFLQGKVALGLSDAGRFLVNSTVGILGFFDPAKRLGLVAHDEDTGQTLAVWGVPQGPYLVLPLLGPDTTRNTPDLITSTLTNVLYYVVNPYITIPLSIVGFIDYRVQAATSIDMVKAAAVDPYIFVREGYLQQREFLIYDGHPPQRFYDDFGKDDAGGGASPPAKDTGTK